MFSKMAGRLSLSELVSNTIEDARTKLAASEGEDDKSKKVKKLLNYEKKEHGHIPSPKEEEEEKDKKASASFDTEEIMKLASALDQVGDQFIKQAADQASNQGEQKNGVETLPVMAPVGGKQSYAKDSSKSHNIPMKTETQKGGEGDTQSTQVKNDHAKAPGGAPFPKKGVMKTAGSAVLEKIRAAAGKKGEGKEEKGESEEKGEEKGDGKKDDEKKGGNPFAAKGSSEKDEKKEKEASAGQSDEATDVDFILNKIANVEKRMGGQTLDSKSGEGPKPPSEGTNGARSMIASNAAATDAKKVQAKAPQKKLMSEVLTEPMQSKAHDAKVQDNLRNASKGGVKIAAVAREYLKKIASEGCTCDGKGECKNCKMKKAMEKKSMGGMPATGPSGAGSSMPTGSMM